MAGKNVKSDVFCTCSKEFVQKYVQKTSKQQEKIELDWNPYCKCPKRCPYVKRASEGEYFYGNLSY